MCKGVKKKSIIIRRTEICKKKIKIFLISSNSSDGE